MGFSEEDHTCQPCLSMKGRVINQASPNLDVTLSSLWAQGTRSVSLGTLSAPSLVLMGKVKWRMKGEEGGKWTHCTGSLEEVVFLQWCLCVCVYSCFVSEREREREGESIWKSESMTMHGRSWDIRSCQSGLLDVWQTGRETQQSSRSARRCGKPVGVPENSPCQSVAPSKLRDILSLWALPLRRWNRHLLISPYSQCHWNMLMY